MVRSYRRRGYTRNYRRSRWPYRSWRRYGSSLTRVSQAGTRRFNLSVPVQASFTMTVLEGKYWSVTQAVSPFSNTPALYTRASIVSSPLYRTYAGLYDQVKINSCYVRLTIMSLVGSGGIVPALRFVTSWDRKRERDELNDSDKYPQETALETGSESQVSLIVNNSRAIINRYCRASDLQERSLFHDCSIYTEGAAIHDQDYIDGKPCGFCPCLMFAVNTATAPGVGAQFSFNVAVDVRWNVTFRNPKYGLSSGDAGRSASFDSLQKEAVKDVKDDVVLPDVESSAKKFDALSDEEKAKIMELIGSMEDEKGAT